MWFAASERPRLPKGSPNSPFRMQLSATERHSNPRKHWADTTAVTLIIRRAQVRVLAGPSGNTCKSLASRSGGHGRSERARERERSSGHHPQQTQATSISHTPHVSHGPPLPDSVTERGGSARIGRAGVLVFALSTTHAAQLRPHAEAHAGAPIAFASKPMAACSDWVS